jgi:murein DD-endopeptidase MepM/ murein hydrolase activator NlpD
MKKNLVDFIGFFFYYIRRKIVRFSVRFEKGKNHLVKFFLMKRGRYNRPFLHLTTMVALGVGILIAPFLADTYPIFAGKSPAFAQQPSSALTQSTIEVGQDVFETENSQKPRDKIIVYDVEKGDTIETIAKKFDISTDTIKWENDLEGGDTLSIGQELKILPVTGVAHKVEPGDTIYSIAKKYGVGEQGIVDFPFNTFANPETFSMVTGQIIIVPGGVEPSSQSQYTKQTTYVASGPMPVSSNGWFFPVDGSITQYPSWYHMAVDIAGPIGSSVYAAHSGVIESANMGGWNSGYGNNVWIDNGDGTATHYAHLNGVNVSVGQRVVGGQTVIGWRGNTGRSTGPHTHFEIRVNGTLVNPLIYVHP